ncbi:hypothetical protein M514_23776 [Trichuris suis]|uniref:Uncharacterized protein n=1 Tax=Trichuris suis TaxID=68888 RepID=A0A085N3M0_9BILA|nr:hypothetical protein M514_23776 [Trichuris suis]
MLLRHTFQTRSTPGENLPMVWWCRNGIPHYSSLPPGQTITSETYCRELHQIHQKMKPVWPAVASRKGLIFLHDSTRPRRSQMTKKKPDQSGGP